MHRQLPLAELGSGCAWACFIGCSEGEGGARGVGQAERAKTNEQTNEWLTVEEVKREADMMDYGYNFAKKRTRAV